MAVAIEVLRLGPITVGALGIALGRRLSINREAGLQLVQSLVAGSLVVLQPVGDEMSDSAFLSDVEAPKEYRSAARAVSSDLVAISSTDDPDRRRELIRDVTSRVEQMASQVNRPVRVVVNEDVSLPEGSIKISPNVVRDVSGILRFETAFDRMHEVRELLMGAFIDLFGRDAQVPLADVAETLVDAVYRREAILDDENAQELGGPSGGLQRLRRARAVALEAVLNRMDEDVEEVVLESEWISRLTDPLAIEIAAVPTAYAVVLQRYGESVVWNDAYAGNSMLLTRLLGWGQATASNREAVKERLQRIYGTDAVIAEDRGLHGFGVNNRPPVLDRIIEGDDWLSMTLSVDRDTEKMVISDRYGEHVNVLSLGSQWPELYPAAIRVAAWIVNSGRLVTDIASEWLQWRNRNDRPASEVPRVRVGSVLRSRRRWSIDDRWVSMLNARDSFSNVCRWRAVTNAPSQMFIKSKLPEALFESMLSEDGRDNFFRERQRSKPQYVDFESVLMVDALPKWLNRRGLSYLEEAMPTSEDGDRAVEFIIELSSVGGEKFGTVEGLR
ncbi:lantibiotic dehydratase family protein [Rathayibacter toxicus]|uniref:lantibiotic dehydratase family protein n=1 Tax=Rathayibacter toxicus TaxID=145458 RepID=UPI001C03F4F1|nr:lantibiotic dehydratase family protein [Rathayibacter toxicus]QWL30900.1 hypothetical protein E2R34_09210 [Rathayibacter toxicus]